jgi:DNA mismatch endonuclease (patch repair protein)
MPDKLTASDRSDLMSRIRSKHTKPELIVRRMLHRMGYRYVLHDRRLPGTPDLAFPARRKVIFVHGCFWHGHDCGRGFKPVTNAEFWRAKIERNQARDREARRELVRLGWESLTVFECALKPGAEARLAQRLTSYLEATRGE